MSEEVKKMRVLKVAPGRKPEIVELENDLEAIGKAVSEEASYIGYPEFITVEYNVTFILNDEGKLIDLKPNRRFGDDILVGTFYIVGTQESELTSLSESNIKKYQEIFAEPDRFTGNEPELKSRSMIIDVLDDFPWDDI